MNRKYLSLALVFLFLLASNILPAQNIEYPTFTVPVYRYAQDQRYSDHKKVFYTADIDSKLAESVFPQKSGKFILDSFIVAVAGEVVDAGVELRVTNTDLSIAISIESFSVTTTAPTTMMGNTTYNVEGKAKVYMLNEKNEPYEVKPVSLSEIVQLQTNEISKSNYAKRLANQNAVINYTLLTRAIRAIAIRCEDSYINSFKKRQITLTSVARAAKKYPELMYFDSLNTRLVNELNAKATTDYKQFIVPYETEIMAFINKEFPKGYDVKNIKVAGYYTLAFLYYLAYDTQKLKQALDFLYENSNKIFGNRIQYNERKPLMTELEAYYGSINSPKIIPTSTSAK